MYRTLIRPLLYLLPAETAHHLAFGCLRLLAVIPGVLPLMRRVFHSGDGALRVRAFGLDFPNPIGLAAGFDKDAIGYEALGALGFGFVEPPLLLRRLRQDHEVRVGAERADLLPVPSRWG